MNKKILKKLKKVRLLISDVDGVLTDGGMYYSEKGEIFNKESQLQKICKKFQVSPAEIAYIGDDLNDLEIMKLVGFAAMPLDGIKDLRKIVDYVCKNNGGYGAFREIVDLIVLSQH